MIAVITGDIINSRISENPNEWMIPLKRCLNQLGKQPKDWEIYRGDSFQLEIKEPESSFWYAVYIKAVLKSKTNQDVRMAIGIGKKSYDAKRITESNGEAFVNSGELFEKLNRKKINLAIKTSGVLINDNFLNSSIRMALFIMDNWSKNSAEIMQISMENPDLSQKEIAKKLGISQASVSERRSRAGYEEIINWNTWFRNFLIGRVLPSLNS